ncbi:MAG TPA: zinc ribbon domain-containing protein [Vicinamibacteria bacterium]|nr:zinc ribbon domain-containing protein [Vicinamibacteria bacterium]
MSRFEQEWALVPTGARWTAGLVCAAVTSIVGTVFFLPAFAERSGTALLVMLPVFLASLVGVAFVGAWVLLVGYVFGDARRRGMNHVLWTLLAIFIPNAIGIILYFILREPIPVPCPACGTPARKGQAFCASCGAAVRAACPQCRQPVEAGGRHCTGCGAPFAPAGSAAARP